MQEQIQEFIEAMAAEGVALSDPSEIIADDTIRRCHMVEDKRGASSVSYKLCIDADGFAFGWFNPYKMGTGPVSWHSKPGRGQTKAVKARSKEWHEAAKVERDRVSAEAMAQAVADTRAMLDRSDAAAGHPYLVRKGVTWADLRQCDGLLMVPVYDADGMRGCQLIAADGKRWFVTGSKKSGAWHLLTVDEDDYARVFIAEGLSTGLTIRNVSGCPVYVAIDAGNMKRVAEAVRKRHPDAQIIVAGDNDQWTRDAKGMPVNTGRKAAEQAALACGGHMWLPEGLDHPHTDWNDAAAAMGLDWVTSELAKLPEPASAALEARYDEMEVMEGGGTALDRLSDLVNPLGYNEGVFYFLPERIGQVVELTTTQIGGINNLLYLASRNQFGCIVDDPQKNSNITDRVPEELMNLCIRRGIYEPSRVFGAGAWRDDGVFRVNVGDSVYCQRRGFVPHSAVKGSGFYVKSRRRYDLTAEPLKNAEAYALRELCEMLTWRRKISGLLLAGWLVIAVVGGALRWRPHVFLTGGAGSGKSTVVTQIVSPMLGDTAVRMDGGSTEAGLRANIKESSLPVLMDEFESESKTDAVNVQKILNWARKASSGGVIVNANDTYRAQSCVFFAAINPALSQRADIDRNTVLELVENKSHDSKEHYQSILDKIHTTITPEYSKRMIRRTVDNIDALLHNCEVFAKQASRILGSQRAGDQIGPMLAGAYMLGSTRKVTDEQAKEWCDAQDWSWHYETQDGTDSERLMQRILTSMVEHTFMDRTGKMPVGELIERVRTGAEGSRECIKTLGRIGIAVRDDKVLIANSNSRLSDLLVGTAWTTYRPGLSRYPGAVAGEGTAWFSGGTGSQRYVEIPIVGLIDGFDAVEVDEEESAF